MTEWEYWWCSELTQGPTGSFPFRSVMDRVRAQLDEQGAQGWELVNHTVTTYPHTSGAQFIVTAFMKRPIKD